MSRGKRIVVDQDEWARLQAAASRLRNLNESLPGLLDDVRRAAQRDFERQLAAVDDRQRAFDRVLASTGEDIRLLERDTRERLAEHARRMGEQRVALSARIDATTSELRREARELVDAERARADEALARERGERIRQVARLRENLNELLSDKERAGQAAREWLSAAAAVRDHIREYLPHERFAPGLLATLEQRLALAERNVAGGLAEAAVSGAQDAYLQLSDLRVDLELRHREWLRLRDLAAEQLRVVAGLVAENRHVKGVNHDGTTNESVVDVDWWTSGRLSGLTAEVEALLDRVSDDDHPLDAAELKDLIDRQAPELERRLGEITQEAGAQQLASQIRASMADAVVQVLAENGYSLDGYTYEGEDYRATLVAKVRHNDGSEIVVRVAPIPGNPPGCSLDIDSFDTTTGSDIIRWERARALADRLRQEGIEVRDPQESGTPDPAVLDLKRIRRARATGTRGEAV